ncbi:hypothetical protein KI387_003161, partial [Taxus chinensis]
TSLEASGAAEGDGTRDRGNTGQHFRLIITCPVSSSYAFLSPTRCGQDSRR